MGSRTGPMNLRSPGPGRGSPTIVQSVDTPTSYRRVVHAAAFARHLAALAGRHEPFAVATVTRTDGSTLAKPGFKILIDRTGAIAAGTLGGGCPEGPIVEAALDAMQTGEPRVLRIHLVDTDRSVAGTVRSTDPNELWVQTNCGGTLEVYVEPMAPTDRLLVVGQGGKDDVEEAVVHLGKRLGFEVVVIDPAPNLAEVPDRLVPKGQLDLTEFPIHAHDSVVVLTKGERDVAVLTVLAGTPARYIGLLASRHRVRQDLEALTQRGVPAEFAERLHAPIGLDIGAKTPEELGLAILADVVATKYGADAARPPARRGPAR